MKAMREMTLLLAFLLMMTTLSKGQSAQKKVALVIGVKSYQFVSPLTNSLNDAKDMAAVLRSKGFLVIELFEPKTKRQMQDAVRKYLSIVQGDTEAAGLVFYSGHGMQVDGANYLIPTQANPKIKADLDDQCLNIEYVMNAIEEAGNKLNIFILDACRNNPFRSFSRSAERGLSMVSTPKGSYIVYSTKPGSVASDGTGRNGLFTSKLLKYINTEGMNIEQVFKRVAADVSSASNDTQRPWIASDYTGDFFFTPASDAAGSNSGTGSPEVKLVSTQVEPELEMNLSYLKKEMKTLHGDSAHYVAYQMDNDDVVFYIHTDKYPVLHVDVNNNGAIDNNIDRAYGLRGGGGSHLCAQYVLSEFSSTVCGSAPSNATVEKEGGIYEFRIPVRELTKTKVISLQLTFYSPTMGYTHVPARRKHVDFSQGRVYSLSVD